MARFFIDRPIFAWVIAIVMMLAGVLSIYNLPVEQYCNGKGYTSPGLIGRGAAEWACRGDKEPCKEGLRGVFCIP